jgi:hypothetical protein
LFAIRPAQLPQALPKSANPSLSFWITLGICHQHADAPHSLGLLRPRRERPRSRRGAAEQGYQLASSYVEHGSPLGPWGGPELF